MRKPSKLYDSLLSCSGAPSSARDVHVTSRTTSMLMQVTLTRYLNILIIEWRVSWFRSLQVVVIMTSGKKGNANQRGNLLRFQEWFLSLEYSVDLIYSWFCLFGNEIISCVNIISLAHRRQPALGTYLSTYIQHMPCGAVSGVGCHRALQRTIMYTDNHYL